MKTICVTLASFIFAATAVVAEMKHMDHSNMQMSEEQMEGAVHTKAVINSMGEGVANVTHDPIPEIGWPAMTMDLTVLEDAQMMGDVAAGDEVTLMLIQGDDGMYAIGAVMSN